MSKLWSEKDFHNRGHGREFLYREGEWVICAGGSTESWDLSIIHPCQNANTTSGWYNMMHYYSNVCDVCEKEIPPKVLSLYRLLTL